jgi:hypothetical protein
MANIVLSKQAHDVMRERNITEEWVYRTVDVPDFVENPGGRHARTCCHGVL